MCVDSCPAEYPFESSETDEEGLFECVAGCPEGMIVDLTNTCVNGTCSTQYYRLVGTTRVCVQDCDLYRRDVDGGFECLSQCRLA